MIQIFKHTYELERDSICYNIDIANLLKEVRQMFGDIFFIETSVITDKGFFQTKVYTLYSLYVCQTYNSGYFAHSVEVINLNNEGLALSYKEDEVILYLKGICDGYKFTKKFK